MSLGIQVHYHCALCTSEGLSLCGELYAFCGWRKSTQVASSGSNDLRRHMLVQRRLGLKPSIGLQLKEVLSFEIPLLSEVWFFLDPTNLGAANFLNRLTSSEEVRVDFTIPRGE